MKMRIIPIIILSLAVALTGSKNFSGETPKAEPQGVAIVIKAIKVVEAREKQENWKSVQRGQQLNSGAQVRTGVQSFSILKFADNSVVRVPENSEIVVRGDKSGAGAMSKTVELNLGKVGFNIKKQGPNEQFRFVSPTSVASIKGTSGYYSAERLLILEGSASLSLPDGTGATEVTSGQIGEIVDGQVQVRKATIEELDEARRVLAELNERIIIKFRDASGNIREIQIE
jgi:hypothetical protein